MSHKPKLGGTLWSSRMEEATLLVAQDELSNEKIAARVGVCRQTLQVWKRTPRFAARVQELRDAMAEAVKGRGIVERENRVAALNDRWEKLHAIIATRAKELADVPGGDTGLLVHRIKRVRLYMDTLDDDSEGDATPARRRRRRPAGVAQVAEYAVDVRLLKELREHEKQAAKELGQWGQKPRPEPTTLVREYVGVDIDGV